MIFRRDGLEDVWRGEWKPSRGIGVIAILVVLSATPFASGAPDEAIIEGQLHTAGGGRPVRLRVLCEADPHGGAISLELWVPQAFKLKDFDYEDFEGPDAAAAERALSRLRVVGGAEAAEIKATAAGWYSGEDPDTFVFGVSQLSHEKGKVAKLLESINPKRTQLVWVQNGFDDPKRELRAEFPLNAATVKLIRGTVDSCLAPVSAKKR